MRKATNKSANIYIYKRNKTKRHHRNICIKGWEAKQIKTKEKEGTNLREDIKN